MKHRSAAERSWVAHIGLLALVIMALAPMVLPRWTVEAPALFGQTPAVETAASGDDRACDDCSRTGASTIAAPAASPSRFSAPDDQRFRRSDGTLRRSRPRSCC